MSTYTYPALALDSDYDIINKFTAQWERDKDPNGITLVSGDRGLETRNGVSITFLKDLPKEIADLNRDGKVDVKDIWKCTPEVAKRIFKYAMWDQGRSYVCPHLTAMAHNDFAVNSGAFRASQKLQNAINKVHPSTPLKVDGLLGPASRAALVACNTPELDTKLAFALIDEREAFLRQIGKRPTLQKFLRGWINRVNALRKFLKELDYYGKK